MNATEQFATTRTGEPHALRRRQLLARHPAIRRLFGYDRRTAWVTLAVVVAQLAIAAAVGRWWVALPLAYAVGAPLTHWLSMAIHETSHRLAARTSQGNIAVALLANVPMVLPVAITFHRYHGDHHTRLGVLGEDTDLPLPFERAHIGRSTLRKAVWLFLHPIVYIGRGLTFARGVTRGELFNAALLVAIDLAVFYFLGGTALVYLAISFYFAHGLHPVAGHFIHEHFTFAQGQETYSYYGPLNAITFNVGHHNEHHDFMNIPGWRLPELTKLVPEYQALDSDVSWTGVLWRFITDPTLGYASRIVRTPEDFQRGRARFPKEVVGHGA